MSDKISDQQYEFEAASYKAGYDDGKKSLSAVQDYCDELYEEVNQQSKKISSLEEELAKYKIANDSHMSARVQYCLGGLDRILKSDLGLSVGQRNILGKTKSALERLGHEYQMLHWALDKHQDRVREIKKLVKDVYIPEIDDV